LSATVVGEWSAMVNKLEQLGTVSLRPGFSAVRQQSISKMAGTMGSDQNNRMTGREPDNFGQLLCLVQQRESHNAN
jgi:hypothetical protein